MAKDRSDSLLSGAGFTRGMLADLEKQEVLAQFGGQGLVTEVLGVIGDGKEATVYACRAHESVGVPLLAAKVYRAEKFRAFRGVSSYAAERTPLPSRVKRAIQNKSTKGKQMAHAEWVSWEYETLCRLHDAGADVPDPLAQSSVAILMEMLGDDEGGAPKLQHVQLTPAQARDSLDRLLYNVETFLDLHLVHGDLSAYNVLWFEDRARIIDVPQSINLHGREDGYAYLARDVANLDRYFEKYGLSARDFAARTWNRYRRGQLGR